MSTKKKRIVIFATHPIQYQVPWFKVLQAKENIQIQVVYINLPNSKEQGVGFGIEFQWDIPLLDGYSWEVADTMKLVEQPLFFKYLVKHPYLLLKKLEPDVIILTGWHMMSLLQILLVSKSLNIPCLVRGESNGLKQRQPWIQLIHRLLLALYDGFLVIGKANHRFYLNNNISEKRLFSSPYFIDNERFATMAKSLNPNKQDLREQWQIPQNAICFCYVGKLESKKRILDLLKALEIVLTEKLNHPVHLLVVGTGELMETAKTFSLTHQLPVTFAGFLNQTEITQAYVASDCLALPSDYGETWGLVVNEAMACGLPCVVSDRVGCHLDLVFCGETGEVFPFGDIQTLAKILSDLVNNPYKLEYMGKNANRLIMEQYSVEKAVEGTLEAIEFVS